MAAVSTWIVREFFEQRGYWVMEPRKYAVTGRPKRVDEEADLVVQHPLIGDARLPGSLLWAADDLRTVPRAVVGIYAWHSERVYPVLIGQVPEITRFAGPDAVRAAAARIGGGPLARILCVPRLPVSKNLRDETLQRLKEKGVDGVLSFRAILADLLARVDAAKNYEANDLLQVVRLLKHYELLKTPQLELFGGARRRPRRPRQPRRPAPPPAPEEA